MKFFGVKNIGTQTLTSVTPWEFKPSFEPGAQIRHDKEARQDWYHNSATEWQFYSALEPVNPNCRVNKDNPCRFIHALVADYDIKLPQARIDEAIASMKIKPQWVETSLGGNARLVFFLPFAVLADTPDFCTFFLQSAVKWLSLGLLPALDEPAFTDPARYLCNGGIWRPTGLPCVSESTLQAFIVTCGREHRFVGSETHDIPLDVIEKEVRKNPAFSWPGEFAYESQGPSWWIPASTSPLSAIVKKEGMFTFSAHADKSFYPWPEIIGKDTAIQFTNHSIAEATKDIWWDGKRLWRRKKDQYMSCDMPEIMNFFKVNCRLSSKPDKSGVSLTDLAMNHIWTENTILGAAPFVFMPYGIMTYQGRRVLNTYVNTVMKPAEKEEKPIQWGDARMQFLCQHFDSFFDPKDQLVHFLAWFKHYYTSALTQTPAPGQNIFMMGPAGVGKTLTSREIIGRAIGGFVDAADHMTGNASFDSEMYEVGLWCVDDETMAESSAAQAMFQAMLKKVAANAAFKYRKKFEVPLMCMFHGRVVVTTNLDYVSTRALGSLDNNGADKLCVFRCSTHKSHFPSRGELTRIIDRELPFFLRFLLDWEPPETVERDVRYGYKAYHEPTLLDQAYQSSKVAPFKELLLEVLIKYFTDNPSSQEYCVTTTELLRLLSSDPRNDSVIRTLRLEQTSRWLELIQREGIIQVVAGVGQFKTRIWKFARFDIPGATMTPAVNPPQATENNPFQK